MQYPKDLKTYLFWAIIVVLIVLSFLLIRPFIIPLISAFILAYLAKPLYSKLSRKTKKPLAATICVLLIVLIIIIPLSALITGITQQAALAFNDPNLKNFIDSISESPILQGLNVDFESIRSKSLEFTVGLFSSAVSLLPSLIISLLITVLGIYYILIKWDSLAIQLEKYLPFKDKKRVRSDIAKATNNIIYGSVALALIQSIFAAIAFALVGVNGYLLAAALLFFLALIPGLGPAIVWIPLAAIYIALGNIPTTIGVIIIGVILSVADAPIRAKLLGNKSNIHPLIMLVGILGGINIFGIFGFVIGPLILVYTLELIEEGISRS